MVELTEDKKSGCLIITRTDSEGFHRQLTLTRQEMWDLNKQFILWTNIEKK